MIDNRKPSGRMEFRSTKRSVPASGFHSVPRTTTKYKASLHPPPPTLKKKTEASLQALEQRIAAGKSVESARKSIAVTLSVIAAAFLLALIWWFVIIAVDNHTMNKTESLLKPMFDAGEVFVGIELSTPGNDKLVAFSPSTKQSTIICRLSAENIAAVSPDKTRLLFFSRMPARMLPDYVFNRNDYWVGMMTLDAATRNIGYVSRGLTAEPLTGGYGMTGVWGSSNDRVFFTMVRKPEIYEQIEGLKFLESLRKPILAHYIYRLDGQGKFTTLPTVRTLRDVLFLPGETWYVSAYNTSDTHLLGMMTDKRHIAVEKDLIDKPNGIFELPGGNIGLITDNKLNPNSSGAIYVYNKESGKLRIALETYALIKRARVDNLNGLLFFIQMEDYTSEPDNDDSEQTSSFQLALYKIPLDRLVEAEKPLDMSALTRVATLSRGGSMGYYDLDTRNRRIVYKEKRKLMQIDYDGGSQQRLWMPENINMQWIQIMYGG